MAEISDTHERTLIAILVAVNAPVSLTDLSNITGLQKTTVSSILNDAAFWGKVSSWKAGADSQTFFQVAREAPSAKSMAHTRWVNYSPPVEEHCQLVGHFRMLNEVKK